MGTWSFFWSFTEWCSIQSVDWDHLGESGEALCLFIRARGGGISFCYRRLSASRPYTTGWLKETDGPLPDSVCGALCKPVVRFHWWNAAFVTPTQEKPNKETAFVSRAILLLWNNKMPLSLWKRILASFYKRFCSFLTSLWKTRSLVCVHLCVSLIIYLTLTTTSLHHSYSNEVIPKWDSHPPHISSNTPQALLSVPTCLLCLLLVWFSCFCRRLCHMLTRDLA